MLQQAIYIYDNMLTREGDDLPPNIVFNGDWTNEGNALTPQLAPVATCADGTRSIEIYGANGGQGTEARAVCFLNTTLLPENILRVTRDFTSKSRIDKFTSFVVQGPSPLQRHLVILFEEEFRDDFGIHFADTMPDDIVIGSLFLGRALVTEEITDRNWSVSLKDTTRLNKSTGGQTYATASGRLFREVTVNVVNLRAPEMYGVPLLGAPITLPSPVLTSMSETGGWYRVNSGFNGQLVYENIPAGDYSVTFTFAAATSTLTTMSGVNCQVGAPAIPAQFFVTGFHSALFLTNSETDLEINLNRTSTQYNVEVRVESVRPVLASGSDVNLYDMFVTSAGKERPVLVIVRGSEPLWLTATSVYGRLSRTNPITHNGGDQYNTSFVVEEQL